MPQPAEPALAEASHKDATLLQLEGFVLDEPTLVNSSVLSYLAMVTSLIEGRTTDREQLLKLLRRRMRQRSIGLVTRREYVLRYLHKHPP